MVVMKSRSVDLPASFGPLMITSPGESSSTPKSARPPNPSTIEAADAHVGSARLSACRPRARRGRVRGLDRRARPTGGFCASSESFEGSLGSERHRESLGELGGEIAHSAVLGRQPQPRARRRARSDRRRSPTRLERPRHRRRGTTGPRGSPTSRTDGPRRSPHGERRADRAACRAGGGRRAARLGLRADPAARGSARRRTPSAARAAETSRARSSARSATCGHVELDEVEAHDVATDRLDVRDSPVANVNDHRALRSSLTRLGAPGLEVAGVDHPRLVGVPAAGEDHPRVHVTERPVVETDPAQVLESAWAVVVIARRRSLHVAVQTRRPGRRAPPPGRSAEPGSRVRCAERS